MGKVISVINMKGGVAKTTLCLSMGEYLADYMNNRVLFIDLDPQFNLTQSLMNMFDKEDEYINNYSSEDKNKTVMKLFLPRQTLSSTINIPKKEELIIKLNNNIDIVCGTIDLILVDSDNDGVKVKKVKKFIEENNLRNEYDFIFIDCPPTITVYTNAAIIASDYYLVPNRIDRYSILGIKLLQDVIIRLIDNAEISIKPLGIVYTMMDESSTKAQMLREKFEKTKIVSNIGLFNNYMRYVKDLLVGLNGNIASNYKKSREDIKALCIELLERIEEDE